MARARTTDDPDDPRLGKQRLARERGILKRHRRAIGAASAPDGVRLDRLLVVLVRTEFEGNIGRAARAMLNMGLTQLCLVAPKVKHLTSAARRPAGHAWEVVKGATVHPTLEQALTETVFSVAFTSARERDRQRVHLLDELLPQVRDASLTGPVALVFGSEADGLSKAELARCTRTATLPCASQSPVLNLSQAVLLASAAVFAFKRDVTVGRTADSDAETEEVSSEARTVATHDELEGFFVQLFDLLDEVGFVNKQKADRFDANVRRLFNRIPLEAWEVALLRGILSSFERGVRKPVDNESR